MSDQPTFQNVPLECVRPSTTNPRKHFNQTALAELAESIKQHGVAQPILVRPIERAGNSIVYYEIVAGERRYRASSLAGYSTVPAIVRTLSDVEALEIQVIENLQRADLHPLEEAEGYEQLMKLHHFTADQLADKVGKSRAYIYARLKLCALEPAARQSFFDGALTASTALLVARIPVKKLQQEAVKEITQENYGGGVMSTRDAQRHIERKYMLQLKDAPFKTSDEKLCPAAGSCGSCKKRTGNQPELFSDIESTDVCTDPVCFGEKREAHTKRLRIQAGANGQTIISGPEAKKIMPHNYCRELKNGYQPQDDEPVLIMSESGMPILETMSGVTTPADYSFECINNYVHCENPDYEDLKNLALGMSSHIDKLEGHIAAARTQPERAALSDADFPSIINKLMLPADHAHLALCRAILSAQADAPKRNKLQLSDEDKAEFHKAAECRDQAVELPSGAIMFINYGEGPQDYSDLDCPHCGGSGHKGDIAEAARDDGPDLTNTDIPEGSAYGSTLDQLYAAFHREPCGDTLAAIGCAIQDLQALEAIAANKVPQ